LYGNADVVQEDAMSTTLEIPFRPGWPTSPEGRIEPPLVPVEPRWEYKEVVREVGGGLLTEGELNALGAEHWELVGIVPAGTQACFYFKRERRS
jgi:hypothetical protein